MRTLKREQRPLYGFYKKKGGKTVTEKRRNLNKQSMLYEFN